MTDVTLLRRGALVRIPAPALGPEMPVVGHAFADLRFDDGHVERWLGEPVLGTTPEDPDLETVIEWAEDDVVDEHDDIPIPADALERAPVEIVFEWNEPLPAELSRACRDPRGA
jgi:hypothetical protein